MITSDYLQKNFKLDEILYFEQYILTPKLVQQIKNEFSKFENTKIALEQEQKSIDQTLESLSESESVEITEDEKKLQERQNELDDRKRKLENTHNKIAPHLNRIFIMKEDIINHLMYLANKLYEKSFNPNFDSKSEILGFLRFLFTFVKPPKVIKRKIRTYIRQQKIKVKQLPWFLTLSRTEQNIILISQPIEIQSKEKLFIKIPLITTFIETEKSYPIQYFLNKELIPLIKSVLNYENETSSYTYDQFNKELTNENRLIARLLQILNIKAVEKLTKLPRKFNYYNAQANIEDITSNFFARVTAKQDRYSIVIINNQFEMMLPNTILIFLQNNTLNFKIFNTFTQKIIKKTVQIKSTSTRMKIFSDLEELKRLFTNFGDISVHWNPEDIQILGTEKLFRYLKKLIRNDKKLNYEDKEQLLFWLPDEPSFKEKILKKEYSKTMMRQELKPQTLFKEEILIPPAPISTPAPETITEESTTDTYYKEPPVYASTPPESFEEHSEATTRQEPEPFSHDIAPYGATAEKLVYTSEEEEEFFEQPKTAQELITEATLAGERRQRAQEVTTRSIAAREEANKSRFFLVNYLRNLNRFHTAIAATVIGAAIATVFVFMKKTATQPTPDN